jgi:hypothetical protein
MKTIYGMLIGLVIVSVAVAAPAYEGGAVSDGGSISGTVKLSGEAPAVKPLDINKDQEVCGKSKTQESLVLSGGKEVKNAVVRLTNISKGKKMEGAAPVIDQVKCAFTPHVVVVPVGKLTIKNSDPITHNVHTFSIENDPINKAQPKSLPTITAEFSVPEVVKTQCDIHKWMGAWIVVVDNPYYAVTDEKGSFKLTDVPPGTYKMEVWHELLGKTTQEVTVKAKADTSATVELKKK